MLERVHHLILTNTRIFCPTYGINGTFEPPEKTFSINCTKENKKFCLTLHYKADNISLFINRKEFFKFKAYNKYVNFPTQFSAGSISNGFSASKYREIFLNGNMYDFSFDSNSIAISDISNMQNFLIAKNNIK